MFTPIHTEQCPREDRHDATTIPVTNGNHRHQHRDRNHLQPSEACPISEGEISFEIAASTRHGVPS